MGVQMPSGSGWVSGLKWGAIVGVAAYLVGLALNFFNLALLAGHTGPIDDTQQPILLVPICLGIFVTLFSCSAAGFYTGRETGQAGLGAFAGVAAVIVEYVLGILYTPGTAGRQATTTAPAGTNMTALVLAEITSILLVLGIAACMGWLGGRPGARRSPMAAQLAASTRGPITDPVEPPEPPAEQ